MKYRQMWQWALTMTLLLGLLSSCAEATPTPILIEPPNDTSIPPPPAPLVILRRPTTIPTSANQGPFQAKPTATITGTVEPSPTLPADRLERPFLMKIDRISVVVGRGILLQGRVTNGALQANGNVELLGPQQSVSGITVKTVLIANTRHAQVQVGDYASLLVSGLLLTDVSPGMLVVEAGAYKSYEAARQQLSGP
jgi:hypothetical protein